MTRRGDTIAYVVSGIAILAFAVLLAFALARLIETENEMRRNEGDNMLWAISQAQTATLMLDTALARHASGRGEPGDIERRYNVLLSRLTLLSEGPQARYMASLGQAEPLAGHRRAVEELEDGILAPERNNVEAAGAIHRTLSGLASDLGRAANQSMVTHWEQTGARLDRQRAAILQVIISILAIIALGVFLCVILLRAMAQKQRIQHSLTQEQEVREAYRSFVALVSHQFRTPLAVIDSSMQRLLRQGDVLSGDELRERARRVRDEVQGLTRLVDTTLDTVRLDGDGIQTNPRECDVRTLAERLIASQTEATPGRRISLSIGDEVPPRLRTDPLLAEQVLGNLLSNAVKYSPHNETVFLRVRAESNRILFSVEDRGVGIPDEEQGRLFSRFFRATSAKGTRGAGIGLSVCHQLAQTLGGHLTFESRSGLGSTFTLALPVAG